MSSNNKLYLIIFIISAIIIFRLSIAAVDFNNWPGFWYSALHVAIVAFGVAYLLRNKSKNIN
jgi:uncharacterized membrane protein YqhA